MGFLGKIFSRGSKRARSLKERQELKAKKALNIDRLDEVKADIGILKKQVLGKKKQMDLAGSEEKEIFRKEIARLFSRIDGFSKRADILNQNICVIDQLLEKLDVIIDGDLRGVTEEFTDSVAINADEAFERLRDTDRAVKDLEEISYQVPEFGKDINVEERLGGLEKETALRRGRAKEQQEQEEWNTQDERLERLLEEE